MLYYQNSATGWYERELARITLLDAARSGDMNAVRAYGQMNGDLKSVSGSWYVSTTQYGVTDYEFLGYTSSQTQNSRPRSDNFKFIPERLEFWAYKQMLGDQKYSNAELAAYYVTKKGTNERGILILPWMGNGEENSDPYVGMSLNDRTITDWDGNVYIPFQALHTHPHYVRPSGQDGDIGVLKYLNQYFPGMNGVILSDTYYNLINSNGASIMHGSNIDLIKGTQSLFPR